MLLSQQHHGNGLIITTVLLVTISSNIGPNPVEANLQLKQQEEKLQEQLKLPKDHTHVIRLPSNPLLKYTSYKDVSILHFRVPVDTRTAYFRFRGYEESKSAFQRKCKPRDISLHLKASSYPVISPENITFPKTYLNANERFKINNLQFTSDESGHTITIDGPQLGNWFVTAFVSWTDPNNDRIEQQGLSASCETLLFAELSVSRVTATIITSGQEVNGNLTGTIKPITKSTHQNNTKSSAELSTGDRIPVSVNSTDSVRSSSNDIISTEGIYKFYVPSNIGTGGAHLEIKTACSKCPPLGFYVRSNAFPSELAVKSSDTGPNADVSLHSTLVSSGKKGKALIKLNLQPDAWHYACLRFVSLDVNSTAVFHQGTFVYHDAAVDAGIETPTSTQQTKSINELQYNLDYTLKIDLMEPQLSGTRSPLTGESNVKGNATHANMKNNGDILFGQLKNPWTPVRFRDMAFYPLLRQSYREFFMFDYDLIPDDNGTVPSTLNLTAGTPVGFAFQVGEVYDIGGTLSFAVSMNHDLTKTHEIRSTDPMTTTSERSGILAEKLTSELSEKDDAQQHNSDDKETVPRSNQTIIVCMHLGEPGVPTWPDKCRYGQKLLPASSIVNNTDSNTSTGLIHVPFPESGIWYVTMGLYCHGAETTARVTVIDSVKEFVLQYVEMLGKLRSTCTCSANAKNYANCLKDSDCLATMNETEILKVKECLMDSKCTDDYAEMTRRFDNHHKLAIEQQFALDNCNTSVIFTASSSPCVAGRCGRFGRCYHYMSGGFVFSTCVCMKGYRGWDCSNDEQVPTRLSILMASLLLTFSNLFFLPSIFIATRRKYYTEGIIYFCAMFFSIFYHACDSGEDEYSFCLVKISVLQFCDFYCGLLAIWVTLVAMSGVRSQFVSLLHMIGAILLAFGTELNKQALWVFLAPALTGICIISVSWGLRCYHSQKLFPARRYLQLYMPFGTVLVMTGLVCYAFLQTKQNYHIVHSIWHMLMALSILCLLPSRKSFMPKC